MPRKVNGYGAEYASDSVRVLELVSELVTELVTEPVTELGRLNVIQTKVPSVPYSGSGNPTALQASTIRLTPVPQLSKNQS